MQRLSSLILTDPIGGRAARGPARFAEVEAVLEAIFGPAHAPPPVPFSPRALPVVIAAPRRRRGMAVGAAFAGVAAIVGLAVGVAVSDRGDRIVYRSMIPVPAAKPAAVVVPVRPVVGPEPSPTVARASASERAAPDRPRAKKVAAVATDDDAPPRTRKATTSARPVAIARKRAGACDGSRGVASFACQVEELDAADKDLVEAYASAIDAGVPRAHLVSVNRRWLSARDRARYDPADAVRSYQKLTGELRLARREELSGDD